MKEREIPVFVAVDTEFATLQGPPHVIEVAGVRFQNGEALDHFSQLIRPEVPIEPEASDIHGIEEVNVRDVDDASLVLAAFTEWIGEDPIFAHDVRSDAWALGFEYARHRVPPPPSALFDSLALARRAFPELEDHRLVTIAEHLELETDGMHRALFDATLCWQVVEAAIESLGGWTKSSLARLVEIAGSRQTLSKAAPIRPNRRPSIVRSLEGASSRGESVRLLYGAAGSPPAALPVRPRWVYQVQKKGYLEAECLSSGMLKTYRLDRVQKVLAHS